MKKTQYIIAFLFLFSLKAFAQKDSIIVNPSAAIIATTPIETIADSAKKYNPNIAIRRSAMIPGWGQATNKKYWKIPLVYGALGTTTYLFFRNLKQYREAREAYILATDNDPLNDSTIKQPYFNVRNQPGRIRAFRNEVRQNVDYSVLFFILFWGLNVADAAVDAHLKTFDINDDLSFRINPGFSPMARTTGVSLVLNIK